MCLMDRYNDVLNEIYKWGQTFLNDFQRWLLEGWGTSALGCWATGKDNGSLGKAQMLLPLSPSHSMSCAHQAPDHRAGAAAKPFALWASSIPFSHPPILPPKNLPVQGTMFIIWPFQWAKELCHLPNSRNLPSGASGVTSSDGGSAEEDPSSELIQLCSEHPSLAVVWNGSWILTGY